MTRGPERLRLDAALAEANEGVVQANGVAEWRKAAMRLDEVVTALRTAANSGLGIGGQTGPAMFKAMRRSADNLQERVGLIREGLAALESAATTIEQVRTQRDCIDTDPATAPLPDPGSFSDDPEWDEETRMAERGKHDASVSAFQDREALREQRAREIAEQFDRRYDEPIAVMKRIHGIPDPADSPRGPGQRPDPGPGGRTAMPRAGGTLTGPRPVQDPHQGADSSIEEQAPHEPAGDGTSSTHDGIGQVIGPSAPLTPVLTASDTASGTGGSGAAGLGTSVGVGLGGGVLLGSLARGVGAIRGLGAGALVGGQPTRPLGGLSRSAASGTLGRPSAAGAPVAGRPVGRGGVGAAASAGRTSGARAGGLTGAPTVGGRAGARAGSSGGPGAVGAGGAARARGAGRRTDAEHYGDGSEWLDDDVAPGLLG